MKNVSKLRAMFDRIDAILGGEKTVDAPILESALQTIPEEIQSPPQDRLARISNKEQTPITEAPRQPAADVETTLEVITTSKRGPGSGHKFGLREAMSEMKKQGTDELAVLESFWDKSSASTDRLSSALERWMEL